MFIIGIINHMNKDTLAQISHTVETNQLQLRNTIQNTKTGQYYTVKTPHVTLFPHQKSWKHMKTLSSSKTLRAFLAIGRNTAGGDAQKAGSTRCM